MKKYFLINILAVVFFLLSPLSSNAATIAHWTFEQSPVDSSGSGLDLAVAGNITYSNDVSAYAPTQYSLYVNDSTSNYLYNSDIIVPTGSNPFTIEFFFKTNVTGTIVPFLEFIVLGRSAYIALNTEGTLMYYTTGRSADSTSANLSDDQWHHAALIFGTTAISFYVDYNFINDDGNIGGRAVGAISAISIPGSFDASNYYDGYLDDVRISTGALSPSEFLGSPVTAIPEPVSGLLLLISGVSLYFQRKKL